MMQCCFSWVLRKCHRPLECGVILAEEYSEDALDLYDAELQKLRKYFKANKDVFSKVAEREELFQKFLMLEVLFEAFSLQWCSRKYEALVHLSFDGWVVAFGTVWNGGDWTLLCHCRYISLFIHQGQSLHGVWLSVTLLCDHIVTIFLLELKFWTKFFLLRTEA